MTNMKSTKRALVSSVLALLVCFTMLLGTTFAWFTDTAASKNNKINAGTLDVELYQWTSATESNNISDSHEPVFDADIKWEPGYTEVVYFSIKNAGNLALQYKVALDVTSVSLHKLTDVMEYVVTPDAKFGDVTAWAGNGIKVEPTEDNATQIDGQDVVDVKLLPGEEHFFALSVHMSEEATNEYMGETMTFDIRVLAGQEAYEEGAHGSDYDQDAAYPGLTFTTVAPGATATEAQVTDDEGYKVGSVVVPTEAVADTSKKIETKIVESTYKANITVAAGMETATYDVSVTNLKEGNTTPVKATLRAPAGLDPATVQVYHYDTLIPSTYNPNTGYVTFETTSFSPFTVVYDAESVFVPGELPEGATMPVADVKYEGQYVNVDLPWGSYGQWSPAEGLEANLEAAFTFACPDYDNATDEEKAIIDAYRYWNCDFYVSLDKALGANEIFLGGNYGTFGWVGFHNGDLTLAANQEIPLLGSVTTNPWTYDDVESFVGEFICGVGDVEDALEGATFTVKLRLTNPNNEAEFYNVNVVTYTFGGNSTIDGVTVVTTAQGLQDALENGDEEVQLGGDIDLNDLNNLFGGN